MIAATAAADTVAAIWEQILQAQDIGRDAEFFDIGGNSMLLLAMIELVQQQTGKEIALDDLSEGITVNKIAGLIA
ncbi:MAG TPA: phosphopantetheine-binding protein [Stellaceae bacterium]|nr:phosphopantetheine-binding protein [Stellaceae bacterium]